MQFQAIATPEAPPIENAAASEDQQQTDQRWRESDEARVQGGMLDDIIQSFDSDMMDELNTLTLGSTASQNPMSPLRSQHIQEPSLQMTRPLQSDLAGSSTQSQRNEMERQIFGSVDSADESDAEMGIEGSDKTIEYDTDDQRIDSTPSPPGSYPDLFNTSTQMWGPKRI